MACKLTSAMDKKRSVLFRFMIACLLLLMIMAAQASLPVRTGLPLAYMPSGDTIYQIDTVFQFEYVYDTIFYYDTLPEKDTTFTVSESVEETDSTTTIKKTLNVVITENRTVYLDKNNIPQFPGREFREMGDGSISEVDFKDPNIKTTPPKIDKNIKIKPDKNPPGDEPVFAPVRGRRDTLFRFDTIVNFRFRNDTVYFEKRPRSDTVITRRTTYEDFGRSVLVKETVSMKITEHQNIYQERRNRKKSHSRNFESDRQSRRSTKIVPSKYRNSFEYTPRGGKEHTYSGSLKLGISWIKPSITYYARSSEYSDKVDQMNRNHQGENSLGMSFTYQYFKDNTGFESGLSFSQHNFSCDHPSQILITDTTDYWEYFQDEIFVYDTTWYIDLDYLLQTGDTLLIPDVDSVPVMVTDSTLKMRVDTSLVDVTNTYNYSFSFLEIPLIGHYKLIDNNFYVDVAAGFIPMFMISKTGSFSYPESDQVIDAGDIDFDYGFALSFYGSAIIGYKFDKRWSVFAEPYIRRNLFSVIQNEMVQVKVNSWGIKTGIVYRLFKIQSK